jgi:hypothetical protein
LLGDRWERAAFALVNFNQFRSLPSDRFETELLRLQHGYAEKAIRLQVLPTIKIDP